jgi:hypothetical protein
MHNREAIHNALTRRLHPFELVARTLSADRARVVLDVLALEANLQKKFAIFRRIPPGGRDVIGNW